MIAKYFLQNIFCTVNHRCGCCCIMTDWVTLLMIYIKNRIPDGTYPSVDARNNWWGRNHVSYVAGRIWERRDDDNMIRVEYEPFLTDNSSVLDGTFGTSHLIKTVYSLELVRACGLVGAMPACHGRIAGLNPSTASLLPPSPRRFKSDNLLHWGFYSCRTFSGERFQVTLSHLSKRSRNVFVKWHDIALYKLAYTLPLLSLRKL